MSLSENESAFEKQPECCSARTKQILGGTEPTALSLKLIPVQSCMRLCSRFWKENSILVAVHLEWTSSFRQRLQIRTLSPHQITERRLAKNRIALTHPSPPLTFPLMRRKFDKVMNAELKPKD